MSDGAATTTSGSLSVHGGMGGDLKDMGVGAIVDSVSDQELFDADLVRRESLADLWSALVLSVPSEFVLRLPLAKVTLDFFRSVAYERLNEGTWSIAEAVVLLGSRELDVLGEQVTSSASASTSCRWQDVLRSLRREYLCLLFTDTASCCTISLGGAVRVLL